MLNIYQKADRLHANMRKAVNQLKELYEKHQAMDEDQYNKLKQCITHIITECIVIKHDNRPF